MNPNIYILWPFHVLKVFFFPMEAVGRAFKVRGFCIKGDRRGLISSLTAFLEKGVKIIAV